MYSRFLSGAGLLETIAPAPENDPSVLSKVDVSRKPGIIVVLSTLGLKSITFLSEKNYTNALDKLSLFLRLDAYGTCVSKHVTGERNTSSVLSSLVNYDLYF